MSAAKKKRASSPKSGSASQARSAPAARPTAGLSVLGDRTLPTAVAGALAAIGSNRLWRDVIAVLVASLVVCGMTGGLVYRLPWLVIGLVSGLVVALVASTAITAALTAGVGTALGMLIGPVTPSVAIAADATAQRLQQGLLATLVAAIAAVGARLLVESRPRLAVWINWLAIALIVGSMWVTALTFNARPTFDAVNMRDKPSLNQQLAADVKGIEVSNDQVMLWAVARTAAAGDEYYDTYRRYFVEWSGKQPASPTNIRFPLISYLLGVVPGSGVVLVFLVAASFAALAPTVVMKQFVKRPLTVPAVAALCSYFLFYATRMHLFTTEVWAVLLGVGSMTAFAVALRSDVRRRWMVVSVIAAVLAVLVRETALFILPAGLAASALAAGDDRRFDVTAWLAGNAVAGVALVLHYWRAASVVDAASTYDQLGSGGLAWMLDGLVWATQNLGGLSPVAWLPVLLALLGLVGIVLIPSARLRWFMLLSTVTTLVAFLFVANQGQQVGTGASVNYWGTVVVPYLYLAAPCALLLLPATAVRGRSE